MPQLIEVPGAGVIEFPDGMDDAAITAAIENEIIPQVAKENDTGFWGAMKGGGYSSLASVNRAGQAVSQMLGYEGGEEYFDKNAQYYQQEAARADPYRDPILEADSFGQGVEGVVEGVAGSIPQLGASLAAGATGAAIGTAIAPGVGTIIGGLGGVLLASQPSLFGENAQEQIEQYGEIRDPWLAFGTSWPQALAETVIAAATFGVGKIAGGMISRGVKSAFLGTGIEGTTELAQTAATIAQAGGDITTPENRMRLAEAAIVGGALGGSVGGVTGAVLGPRSTKADPETGLIDPATLEQADRENVLFDMANDPEVAEVLRANGIDPAAEGFAQSDAAQSFLDRIIERRNREAARSMDADGGAQSARQAAAPVSEQIRTLIEEDAFADAELAASRDAGEAALTADVDAMRQERDRLAERGVNVENPALPVNRRIKRAEENLESYKRGRNEKAPGYRRMSPLFAQGLGQLDDPSYREPLANRQEIESEEQAAAGLPNRQNKQGFDYTGVNRSLGAKRVEFPPEYAAIEREAQQAQQAQAREERRAQAAAGRPAPIASPPGVPPRAQPPLPEQPRRTAQDEFAEWNEISRKLYENGAVVGADGMPMNFTPEQLTGLDPKEALALHAALGRRGRREGQSAVERRFPELFSEQAAQSRPGFTQRNIRDRTGQAGTNYQGAQRGLAFERPAQGATSTETPTSIPSRRPIEVDDAVTSDGTRVPVEYAVVELDDLTPSQTDDGRVNPAYPSDMQPRDRSRGMSQQQVNRIARQLDPRLLDRSPKAGDGAPIVAADGVVESGNGRVLALRQAYRDGGAAAQRYRDYLTAQGYPVEGLARPTLVRIRTNDMTPGARRAFTREANERDNLSMSTTEQAMADASAMTDGLMLMHRGGDADSAGNRDYVRAFIRDVVGANDQAGMIDREGAMSQTAKRRIESALLARAYGSADLVAATTESADSNIRAIGGALVDVAGDWARMRTDARTNQIDPKMDQTDALSEAVRVVQRARREGREVSEYVNQTDMLTGRGVSPMAETFLRLMFRNPQRWTQPVGRNKLADALRYYTEEAGKTSPGADMFGETTATTPEKVAANAQRLVNDGLFDVAGRGQGDLLENPIGDDPNNPQAQATEQAPGQDAIYQAERQAGDIREQRAIDREDAAFINAERQASQDQSPLRPRDVDEDIPFGMGDPVAPRTELAPGQDTVGPEGLRLIHGTTREELTLDDVQIVREGAKQSKRGRKTGGFYASSVNDTAHAETYAAMAGGRGKLLDVIVAPGTRVLRFDGDVTRLSEGQINAWTEQGYGLVIGKDMRGRTEHAIIDKNAIQSLGPTTSARTEAAPQAQSEARPEITQENVEQGLKQFKRDKDTGDWVGELNGNRIRMFRDDAQFGSSGWFLDNDSARGLGIDPEAPGMRTYLGDTQAAAVGKLLRITDKRPGATPETQQGAQSEAKFTSGQLVSVPWGPGRQTGIVTGVRTKKNGDVVYNINVASEVGSPGRRSVRARKDIPEDKVWEQTDVAPQRDVNWRETKRTLYASFIPPTDRADGAGGAKFQATEQAPDQTVEQTTGFRDVGRGERTSQKIDNGVYGTVRPELTEDGKKAADAALKILKRIAPRANSQLFENLTDENGNVKGFGVYLNNVINLALDNPDIEGTARHEAIHFLKETGAITPKQWEALVNTARRNNWVEEFDIVARYKKIKEKLTPEQVIEESIAEAYTAWANGDLKLAPQGNAVMRALQRIFERVRGAVREALGYDPDYKDIFSRVESGKADRGPRVRNVSGAEAAQGMRFQPAGNPISAAFKRWFGDSKVVDANGEPLVVYHGTGADIEAFDLGQAGKTSDSGFMGKGFYFSDSPRTASAYTLMGRNPLGNANVIPAYLALKNPFMWGEKGQGVRGLIMRGDRLPEAIHDEVIKRSGFSFDPDAEPEFYMEQVLSEAIRDVLVSRGHDGVIASFEGKPGEFVAFDPTQIKSATGNNGNYDPNDPRVNYQAPGLSETPAELAEARPDAVRLFQSSAPARRRANDISQNPVLRPTTWQRLMGQPSKAIAEIGETMMTAVNRVADSTSERSLAHRIGDIPRALLYSNIAVMESIAAAHPNNPAAQKAIDRLAGSLGSRAGSGVYRAEGYEEGVNARANQFASNIEKALGEEIYSNPERMDDVRGILQKTTQGRPENRAAAKRVRKVFDDIHAYMRKQGVDVGYVKDGYFPRILSRDLVASDPQKFIKRAAEVYRAETPGMSASEAQSAAQSWAWNVMVGRNTIANIGGGVSEGSNIVKERVFKTNAPERLLKEFYEPDPLNSIQDYSLQAARRGEYAKRFFRNGKDTLPELLQDVKNSGIDANAYEAVEGAMLASLGRRAHGNSMLQQASSWLQTVGMLTLLPRATFSSIAEPATVGVRTGSGLDGVGAFARTLRESWRQVKGVESQERRMAEALGYVGSSITDTILQARMGGELDSRAQQKIAAKYFRYTGLHHWSNNSRIGAMPLGQQFIKNMLIDLDTHPTTAQEALNDLGISAKDAPAMRKWLSKFENDMPTDARDVFDAGAIGEVYQAALGRFLRETASQSPTLAERPLYASHPVGRMILGLTAFLYGFGRNVVGYTVRRGARGLNPKSGLSASERVADLMPIAGVAALVAAHGVVSELREWLFNPEKSAERDMGDRLNLAVTRSGILGPLDPAFNAITGLKYQRDLANLMLGPGLGFGFQQLQDILGLYTHNSENTNTAERNAVRGAYGLTVMPALAVMLGMIPQTAGIIPIAAAAAGLAKATSPSARDWVADTLIGKSDAD